MQSQIWTIAKTVAREGNRPDVWTKHKTYQSRRMAVCLLGPLRVSRLFRLVIFQSIFLFCVKLAVSSSGSLCSGDFGLQAALETQAFTDRVGDGGCQKREREGGWKERKAVACKHRGRTFLFQFWRKTASSYSCSYHAWSLLYPLRGCPITRTKIHDQKLGVFW